MSAFMIFDVALKLKRPGRCDQHQSGPDRNANQRGSANDGCYRQYADSVGKFNQSNTNRRGAGMSMTALRAAFAHVARVQMSIPAKLVLLALADFHNQETGRCDPSNERLRKATLLGETTVRKSIRELEALSIVTTVERKQRSGRGRKNLTNRYRISGLSSGAQCAGGMGHSMPPNHKITTPSAFDALAMSIESISEVGDE